MRIRKSSAEHIERRVRKLSKLSTLPYVAAKVVELVENPKTSASTLGKIVAMDQVLAARILKLANSAYYGFPRRISTINLAIVVLGFNTLRDLVMSISLIDQFTLEENEFLNPKQFWRHAVLVGMGARAFSKYINYPVPGEVFVGGLLHDIGLLVLYEEFPEVLPDIYSVMETQEIDFEAAMLKVLGCSRYDLGAWLSESWNLPPQLVRAIRYHKKPERDPGNSQLTWIIHLTDLVSNSVGETEGFKYTEPVDSARIEATMNTFFKTQYDLHFFQEIFRQEIEKIDDFVGILTKEPAAET